MWLIYVVVWGALLALIGHISLEWWRDFKKERAEQRLWDIDRRRASLRVVKP